MKVTPILLCVVIGSILTQQAPAARPTYNTKHQGSLEKTRYTTSGSVRRPRVPLADAYWKLDGEEGPPKVIIDRGRQVAYFYKGDTKVGQSPVATGRKGFETPAGTFTVQQKKVSHYSSLYGSFISSSGKHLGDADAGDRAPSGARYAAAPMPYFMRLTDCGVGMHAGYVPGVPASHGCIRLPREMAQKFFQALPIGSTVVIR